MTSREFCYWLQGFFELQSASSQGAQGVVEPLTLGQAQVIQNHLNMVFKHEIDPSQGSAEHQAELSAAHEGASAEVKNPDTASAQLTEADVKRLIEQRPHRPHFDPMTTKLKC